MNHGFLSGAGEDGSIWVSFPLPDGSRYTAHPVTGSTIARSDELDQAQERISELEAQNEALRRQSGRDRHGRYRG